MKRLLVPVFLIGLTALLSGQEFIEKIEITGNDRVTRDTVMYYLGSKEGGVFDEASLRRDFAVLWSTGFFSNIRIAFDKGARGRIVKIAVEENPIIKEVSFRTGKKVKEDDIVNKLKEKDEYLLPYSYYSPAKIQKIRNTIEALLVEKGLDGGEVSAEIEKKGRNELGVLFRVKEGLRSRVGRIVFEGDLGLHEDLLMGALKDNKVHDLLSWIVGKDTYKANKLSGDLTSLKTKLQENGYMEAYIGEPRVEETTRKSIFLKTQKMKKIIIPVAAGDRYSLGEVKIDGNKLIHTDYIRSLFKTAEGETYSVKAREKAVEQMGELYRNIGYLYAQVIPVESLDPKGKKVNVTFNISEGEVAYLNRLEFKGNTFTKDKVIRRELIIREGDRFGFERFKNSVLRLKQLGIVDVDKEPDIKPDPDDPTQVNVNLNVKELQRNNIQFSAGYSGYQGTFIMFGYSTVNFFGTGESLDLMLQYGKRIQNYSLSFTEPYFLDLPLSAGFSIFNRYMYYPGLFTQKSRGINLNVGMRILGFWKTNVSYGYEYLDMGSASEVEDDLQYSYNPYYYGGYYGFGNYFVGSLSTAIYRSTIDSPLTPSTGSMYMAGIKVAGGPFGGEIKLIKPQFEWSFYRPVGIGSIGLHVNYEFVKPWGDGISVPFWERFYLGGERSIRGYEIYTIGPLTEQGINKGGEKSLVINSEYIIPLAGPLYSIFFCDLGNAWARRANVQLDDLYLSAGLEMRIFVPALRVPFRLIFAYNNRKIYASDNDFAFRFAIGTTF